MPTFSASSPTITSLADQLTTAALDGRAARVSVGAKDAAFAWTQYLPSVVARYVSTVEVHGPSYTAVVISPTGTPGSVAEGGTKATLASAAAATVTVKKYPGRITLSTERMIQTDSMATLVNHVLVSQCLIGYDKDVVAALVAGAGATGSGASWSEAILDGIASVVANGGNPDTLVLSGADYAAAMESPGAGYLMDPREGIAQLFGLRIALSAGATTGEAFVLDSSSVTCGEDPDGPYVLVDPYSGAGTNAISVYSELFASVHVNGPGGVAALTVTP